MKQLVILSILVFSSRSLTFAQMEVQLLGGANSFHLNFPGFQTYLDSYNALNSGSSMIKPAKFNHFGVGYHVAGMFRLKWFVTGISMGQITGFPSTASFEYDQSRSFRFKNTYFDLQIGGRIGGEKFAFLPFVSMSVNTLNLNAYFMYGDVKSYGGEKALNGMYTSWRLIGLLGGRLEYRFNDFLGAFAEFNFTLNKSEYLGGDFSESNSATDSKYFQATADQDQISAINNGLKEVYRISRGVFGLQLTIGVNEKE